MGASISERVKNGMAETMSKQMDASREMSQELGLKQRQMGMAMGIAMAKQRFYYFSFFFGTLCLVLPTLALRTKKPALLVPLLPLGCMWCFQYDMIYMNLQRRAQVTAAKLISEEPERFFLPQNSGLLTQQEYNKILDIPADYKPKLKP